MRKRGILPDWLAAPADFPSDAGAVERALTAATPGEADFWALTGEAAAARLETLAARSRQLTQQHFGRVIALYAPLYLANYCSSGCRYCGFASDRKVERTGLSLTEARNEMASLHDLGIRDLLLLTGDRTKWANSEYVHAHVEQAAERFPRVGVEVFPMKTKEYAQLVAAGCTAVTLYQETYDPELYGKLHPWGPKHHYNLRLEGPERALSAGIRELGIGALYGLGNPRLEALQVFRHLRHLQRVGWRAQLSVSFPRIRPQVGGFQPPVPVNDRLLAQLIFAFRICLPTVPLLLSTRERASFRDGMAGLGINKMSVASRTTVGGYGDRARSEAQFEISDDREVAAFCAALAGRGLQPVFKDWDGVYR
jgi:2-iminoacetate synthase